MNYLAHALLAGDDAWLRLGGLFGDFVHGQPDPALPPRLIDGIRLHRAIDSYTDSHAEVRAARERLSPPYRRYAGILLDMWFDHCLARDFGRWSTQPLEDFSRDLRVLLWREDALLPPALQRFRDYMEAHGLPARYAERSEIGLALHGIAQRLRRENPLDTALPVLVALEQPLQQHFEVFFPALRDYVRDWLGSHPGAPESR